MDGVGTSSGSVEGGAGRYVVVTGAIAAGATTLSKELVARFGWTPLLEGLIDESNPFHAEAYGDPNRWRFHSQTHFLAASARRHAQLHQLLADGAGIVVEDRTPFEHNGAYTEAHSALGNLTDDEATLLLELGEFVETHYRVPDLLIYRDITRERVIEAVAERARPGEDVIDEPTLLAIWEAFNAFADSWTRSDIIRIPAGVDVLDPKTFDSIAGEVAAKLGR